MGAWAERSVEFSAGGCANAERSLEHVGAGDDPLDQLGCDIYRGAGDYNWDVFILRLYTGCFEGLPATGTIPEVTPRLHVTTRTTLRDWEAEVRRPLDGELRERKATEQAWLTWAMTDERGRALSPLWPAVFTWGGLQVLETSGDAVESVVK